MSKFAAIADHLAKKAKAYVTFVSGLVTAVAASGSVLPSPEDRYLSLATAVIGAWAVFKVPNRPENVIADIDAASTIVDAIRAAGAPAADAPHPPADLPTAAPAQTPVTPPATDPSAPAAPPPVA